MRLIRFTPWPLSLAGCFALLATALPLDAATPKVPADLVAVKIVERDYGRASSVLAGAHSVVDYGSFRVALVDAEAATVARESGAQALDYRLDLGGVKFDPAIQSASVVGMPQWTARTPGDELFLLQFAAPIRTEWIEALQSAGLKVIRSVQPFSMVVWGDAEKAEVQEADQWLRYVGPAHPSFRLLPSMRFLAAAPVSARALVVRDADPVVLQAGLESLGASVGLRRSLDARLASVGFVIAGNKLPEVAALPGIYSVRVVPSDGGLRGEMSAQVHAGNVDGDNRAISGYQAWLSGLGLDGSGVLIANVDGGVDGAHPDLVTRMNACAGTTCSGSSSSHGTHTAGIMAGDGSSGIGVSTANGNFLRGLGVAPGADLIEQLYSPTFIQPGGMLLLMTESWRNGAALSGNSWGPAGTPQGYDDDTMQVDIAVRDADPDLAGNQPLTFVLSFMNGYGGVSSQGSPDEAKNLLNVGSTKMQSSSTLQITAIDDLSANSAHGPALDGRIIPHIVAPGCSVDSTEPGASYGLKCGTSMASPHVSGTVALFIEQYRDRFGVDPSPALIKAAFLGTARSLSGNLDADGGTLGHPFDSKQGWGRAAPAVLLNPPANVEMVDQTHVFAGPGGSADYTFEVDDPTQPVRIMLVWTDAPGHGLGGSTPAWNNDLDLEVDADSVIYRGNVFSASGWSMSGGSADGQNNTEGVFLAADPARSAITIRVLASDVASDGIPGTGTATDQDFALYCLNCLTTVGDAIFSDGFESGNTRSWSPSAPPQVSATNRR